MKKTSKLMALLIVLAMLASMMSFFTVSASADAATPSIVVSEEDTALSVKLRTLGVITGEFNLSNYVTRGEMASITAKYAGIPASADAQVFNDVTPEHPYYDAIGALYNMGVVTGHADGNFGPDDFVTYDQALVYVINAIGHKPFAVREGGYPTGYHRIAIKHGMLAELSMKKGTDYATLADIYRILDEGLTAAAVETSYYGDGSIRYNLSDTDTFLSEVYNIRQYRGIITGIPGTRLTAIATDIKEDQIEINGKKYELYGYPEFSMLGYSVDFYVNADDPDVILHVEETKRRNELLRIDADDLDKAKTTETRVYYRDDNDREYHIDLDLNFNMIYNNQYYDMYGVLSRTLPDNGYIEVLDNNGDGAYDTLFIYTYFNAYVEGISSDATTVRDKISGTKIDLSDYHQVVNVYYNGSRKLTADSIQLGDVLSIVESKNAPKVKSVYITRNAISGRIEGINTTRSGEYKYSINGEWYDLADPTYAPNLSLGLEGTFYLDMNNDIAFHSLDMTNRKGETGVMSALDYKLRNLGSTVGVRIYTEKGEFLYADLKENVKIDGRRYDLSDIGQATEVVSKLATVEEDGVYKIDSVYIVNYVVNEDNLITELDLGGIGGAGALNLQASRIERMLVRTSNILSYTNHLGVAIRQRLNPKNKVIFGAPADGDLENLDAYQTKSIVINEIYGIEANATQTAYIVENIDIYTYHETEYPMADVILFRGTEGVSKTATKEHDLDIIKDVGTAVTEDGVPTCKLYMANSEYLMAPEVTLTKAGVTTENVAASSLLSGNPAELRKGVVIQYVINTEKQISAIRIVADYNATTGAVNSLFDVSPTKYIESSLDAPTNGTNTAIGIIDGVDFASQQIYFKTFDPSDNKLYFLYQTNDNVVIYDSTTGEITKGSASDITPGDKFVASLGIFYIPQTLVIFR